MIPLKILTAADFSHFNTRHTTLAQIFAILCHICIDTPMLFDSSALHLTIYTHIYI